MDAGDWISLAGVLLSSVVAVVSAAWAVASARRARAAGELAEAAQVRAEQQAERATRAAEESAVAERQAVEAAKRVAGAIEKQNAMAQAQAELEEGVPWRLEHQRGDVYELVNLTATPKFGVSISGESVMRRSRTDRIDGYSRWTFMAMSAMGVGDAIEVRWHRCEDLSDEEHRWSGPKPPRPQRR